LNLLAVSDLNREELEEFGAKFTAAARAAAQSCWVSRAQRSTKWCAADPGSSRWMAVPDQRRTAEALRRIRDTAPARFGPFAPT
jgi:hypothetical protein